MYNHNSGIIFKDIIFDQVSVLMFLQRWSLLCYKQLIYILSPIGSYPPSPPLPAWNFSQKLTYQFFLKRITLHTTGLSSSVCFTDWSGNFVRDHGMALEVGPTTTKLICHFGALLVDFSTQTCLSGLLQRQLHLTDCLIDSFPHTAYWGDTKKLTIFQKHC